MTYRDSLIERLMAAGHWEQMPAEDRERFRGMSDDDARRLLVIFDELDMGDPDLVRRIRAAFADTLRQMFRGALVESADAARLAYSAIGKMLVAIIVELQAAGLDSVAIGDDFAKFTVSAVDRTRDGDLGPASGMFLGKLVEYDERRQLRPSPIANKLSELVQALRAKGLADAQIEAGFGDLNAIVVELFAHYHEGLWNSEPDE